MFPMAQAVQQARGNGVNDKLKIFISYSRTDAAAADALVTALEARDFEVTIDKRNLPFGEEWQKELAEFIRLSDTVIWLVSKPSIESKWVNWELDEVKARNKRLVPVMVGLVNPAELPRQLGKIHILPPDHVFELARDLDTLVQVLETDQAWLKQATRWQDRAAVWLANDRASGRLLSRGELADAEQWKDRRPTKAPAPAQEVMDLLLASRQAVNRWQRRVMVGSVAAALVAIGLAGFAVAMRQLAVVNEATAINNEVRARDERNRALLTQSKFLAPRARSETAAGDAVTGALIALEALAHDGPTDGRPAWGEANAALETAVWRLAEVAGIPHVPGDRGPPSPALSQDDKLVVSLQSPSVAVLWEARTARRIAALPAMSDEVSKIAFSPDGDHVLVAGCREMVMWRVADRVTVASIVQPDARAGGAEPDSDGCTYAFTSVTFVPSSRLLMTLSVHNILRLWDGLTGTLIHQFDELVAAFAVSPTGHVVLAATPAGEVLLWDRDKMSVKAKWIMGTEVAEEFAFSVDGRKAVVTTRSSASIVNTTTGALHHTLRSDYTCLNRPVFSHDGTLLLTSSEGVCVWDTLSGALLHRVEGGSASQFIGTSSLVPLLLYPLWSETYKGREGINWQSAREFGIWDGRSGEMLAAFAASGQNSAKVLGRRDELAVFWSSELVSVVSVKAKAIMASLKTEGDSIADVTLSPNGRLLITSNIRAPSRIWNLGMLLDRHSADQALNAIRTAALTPDGASVLTSTVSGRLLLLNASDGALQREFAGLGYVTKIEISPDGDTFIALSNDAPGADAAVTRLRQVAISDGSIRAVLDLPSDALDERTRFSFSSDSRRLLLRINGDNKPILWNVPEARILTRLIGHDFVWSARFSPDGRIVATAGDGASVQLWDASTGERLRALPRDPGSIFDVRFSNSGETLRTNNGSVLRTWNVISGLEQDVGIELVGSKSELLLPDGHTYITAISDPEGMVEVRDGLTGAVKLRFKAHSSEITWMQTSPDSALMLTTSTWDFREGVLLWDLKSGVQVAEVEASDIVREVSASPSWQRILIIDKNFKGRIRDVSAAGKVLIERTKGAVPRCLTDAQRSAHFLLPEPPRWCITGPTLENVSDTTQWKPKWPYDTPAWRDWLVARDRGEKPPLPRSE